MKKRFWLLLLFVFCSLFLFACGKAEKPSVTVLFRERTGVKLLFSEALVTVNAGEDVSFNVVVDKQYCYLGNSAGAEYSESDRSLVLKDVLFPTTIDFYVGKRSDYYRVLAQYDAAMGAVTLSDGNAWAAKTNPVKTLSAEPRAGYLFVGWSTGGFLADGGKQVSASKTATFTVGEDTTYYANFIKADEYALIYDPNGGQITGGGSFHTEMQVVNTVWCCRQVLEDNGLFTREGYYPVGYSTSPVNYEDYDTVNDIPGFVNLGGSFIADGAVTLYVVWAKESDPENFDISSDGVIQAYLGGEDTVVIPAVLKGKTVVGIAKDAFKDCSAWRIVLPKTVKTVADGAFKNCENLTEFLFFDTLEVISDASFAGCDSLQTVVLSAARLPRFAGTLEGAYAIKYNLLRAGAKSGKKRIVVVSGSSSLYGLDSTLLGNLLDEQYDVLNFGTNAGHTVLFMLDVVSNYVNSGDIVIHAPEYSMSVSAGLNVFTPKTLRGYEQCYDMFREVDMRNYTGFFDAWNTFQNDPSFNAKKGNGCEYHTASGLDEHGDLIGEHNGTQNFSVGSASLNAAGCLSSEIAENLNRVAKQVKTAGGVMLGSFAPYDVTLFGGKKPNESLCDAFTEYYELNLDYDVISSVGDYIYDHSFFYNSAYHPNDLGTELRTETLADDIEYYLATKKGGK